MLDGMTSTETSLPADRPSPAYAAPTPPPARRALTWRDRLHGWRGRVAVALAGLIVGGSLHADPAR